MTQQAEPSIFLECRTTKVKRCQIHIYLFQIKPNTLLTLTGHFTSKVMQNMQEAM